MTNSAKKGNAFENWTANTLSKRFEGYLGRDKSFSRHSDSGSFNYGDINCPDIFKWVIECKNVKKIPSLSLMMKQDVKQWDEWIEQVTADGIKANKQPLLIIRYIRTPEIVLAPVSFMYGDPVMLYGGWGVYLLEKFLKLDDEIFFGENK